jgi:hypothetical protein
MGTYGHGNLIRHAAYPYRAWFLEMPHPSGLLVKTKLKKGDPTRLKKDSPARAGRYRIGPMKIQALTVGLRVKHPHYGVGVVKSVSEHLADIRFEDAVRSLDPEASEIVPAEASLSISGLEMSLNQFVESIVERVIERMGVEQPESVVEGLAIRWHNGKVVLHPADPGLQTKEIPMEVFFHKVVGIRNQLRVLEQKVNAHTVMTDAEKVELQQYITRCYGSLTTFNLLFKHKEEQFSSKGE